MGYEDIAKRVEEQASKRRLPWSRYKVEFWLLWALLLLALLLPGVLFVGASVALVEWLDVEKEKAEPILLAVGSVSTLVFWAGVFSIPLILWWNHRRKLFRLLHKPSGDLYWLNNVYKTSSESTPEFLSDERSTFWRGTDPYDGAFDLKEFQKLTGRVVNDSLTSGMQYWTGWRNVKAFYLHQNDNDAAPVYAPALILRILYDILNDDAVQKVGIKNVIPMWAFTSDREFGFELWIRWNDNIEIVFLVKATHFDNQVTVSLGHHILWHQFWMNNHPRTPSGEMGLALGYHNLSQPQASNLISSAHKAHKEGRIYTKNGKKFYGGGTPQAQMRMSKTGSFLFFSYEDPDFGQGTQIGAFMLRLMTITKRCCELTCEGEDGWEDKSFTTEVSDDFY